MRLFYLILSFFVLISCSDTKSLKGNNKVLKPLLVWSDTIHHFGKVNMNNPVDSFDFHFKNLSGYPLVILHAKTSCHCTEVIYPKKPINSGDSAYIRVIYNGIGRQPEFFRKTVNVFTNLYDMPIKLLIDGKLEY